MITLFALGLTTILVALIMFILTECRMEVKPATALVYNNIWTGQVTAVLAGTHFMIPGIHRILEKEVGLQNEAENPASVALVTKDGIELKVDYVIRRLQVGYPGMPMKPEDGLPDFERLRQAVLLVVTKIKYANRRALVLSRIVVNLKAAFAKRKYNDLFLGADLSKHELGDRDKGTMEAIETEINTALLEKDIVREWGLLVEMDLEDYAQPESLKKAREQSSSAATRGKALKDQAEAAGNVDVRWLIAADAIKELFGGGKKS